MGFCTELSPTDGMVTLDRMNTHEKNNWFRYELKRDMKCVLVSIRDSNYQQEALEGLPTLI